MANQFTASGGTYNIDTHVDLLNRAIDAIFMERNEVTGAVLAPFFHVLKKNGGLTHRVSAVTSQLSLPRENRDDEDLPFVMSAPGYDKTFTLTYYRSGVRVTRGLLEADLFDMAASMVTGQMKSGLQKDEYMRASIINNSFTSGTGGDGSYMCADSHAHENPEAGTWDNKGTGVITGGNLHALRLLTQQMTDPMGYPAPMSGPFTLLGSETTEQKRLELTTATYKPETAQNDENVLIKGLRNVTSVYLSDAPYFLIGNAQGYDKGLFEIVLSDWDLRDDPLHGVDIVIQKRLRATKTFGFLHGKNVFGSTGA